MIYPNSTGNTKVPLGITYLLTILKNAGHEVRLFDMTFYGIELEKHDIFVRGRFLNFKPIDLTPYGVTYQHATMADVDKDLASEINSFKPDLIGVSITEDTSKTGIHLAEVAKHAAPETPIIFGGVFCMSSPEWVIEHDCVDLMCTGEGEELIIKLTDCLTGKKSYNNIPGLWIKKKDGSIIKNELARPVSMDSLPYLDLSLADDRHFYNPMAGHVYKMTFVQSQRGCPRRCTYCCNQLFLNTYKKTHGSGYLRKQSIPRFVEEMADIKQKYGMNFFQIVDDDFTLRPLSELREFARLYKEMVDLPWWIQAEANHITDEKIAILVEAGLMGGSVGIETGSDYIREKVYKRNTSKAKTLEAFEIMHRHGMRTSGNIIIGVPHEGRKEIFETIELTRQCQPKSLNVNIFAPYRGTELRDYCVKMGYLKDDFIRNSAESWKPVIDMPQISHKEIEGFIRTFILYSFLPKKYWPKIKKCEEFSLESDEILQELEEIFWEIAEKRGINYDVPGYDYDAFLAARQKELESRAKPHQKK
jgi:anaerobic magnesium-protoporphyrin IX monomethyl ester cyclase